MPLVGREQELALLLEHWQRARTGKGQVVLLIGEPGIGKSRLVLALRERLRSERRTRLRYQCSSHRTDTPLWPVVEQLERAAGFARGDPPEIKLGKIEALLGRALPDPATAMPALAELLSLPANGRDPTPFLTPEQKKAHVFQVLLAQLDGLAAQGPVLMVLEDAHWLDPTTLELFDLVVGRVEQLNVLLIITCRPGFDPPWTGHAHVASLSLARLERHQAAEVVERVTGGRMLPPEVLRQILEKTDGVPLFVEELTKAVLESGVLRGVGDHYELTGPLPPLAIPSTLQDSLTARLDRSAPLREVAQIGAAIGREFSYELLAAVAARPEDELHNALAQLMSAGLVLARGQPPEAVYTFKHALVQDAAYATLIRVRRAQIHGQIASSMAERHPDLVRRQPEVLARHLTEAGLTSEAIEYWLKAGQLAAARSATVEAVSHLTNGLGLLARLEGGIERDRMELEFQTVLGPALNAAKGYAAPETMAAFQRAQELIRQTGDRSRQNAMLTGLFVAYFNRAEFQKAYEVAAEFLNTAERQDDPAPRCIGHRMVAASLNTMGDFRPALPHAEAALAFYDPERHGPLAWHYIHDLGVAALNHLGISLWHAGCVDRSIMCEREALALADRLRHPNSTGYALWYCGVVSAFRRRDFGELQCQAEHLRAYGRDHDLPHWVQFAMCLEGTALAAAGHAEDGITLIQEGIRACEVTHSKAFRPAFLAGLAEAQLWANRWNEAEQTIETALRMSEQTFERWMDAELWRLKGQASVFSGRQAPGETEALFRRAAECAERQGSRPLHLRAVTSLARLWHDQGRGDEARDLLVPIHAWFSDGFDTPDLRDARALLAELRCRELPCRPPHE